MFSFPVSTRWYLSWTQQGSAGLTWAHLRRADLHRIALLSSGKLGWAELSLAERGAPRACIFAYLNTPMLFEYYMNTI